MIYVSLTKVELANYGRMRIGKCLKHGFGSLDCSVNILPYMDWKCSGRVTCSLNVRDLMEKNPCPKELRSYLTVKYKCVKVEHPAGDLRVSCQSLPPSILKASLPSGILSNYVAEVTGCGGLERPWSIVGSPGQRINMTIMDFVEPSETSWIITGTCHMYANLHDGVTGGIERICIGGGRVRHAFISKSHLLKIEFIIRFNGNQSYALFFYEVIGCADIATDAGSNKWFRRYSSERASYGCNNKNIIYELKCVKNKWVGEEDNCSQDGFNLARNFFNGNFFTIEKIIVTILVTGLIGVIVLIAGVIIVRKKFKRRSSQHQISQPPHLTDNPLLYSQKTQYIDRSLMNQQQQQQQQHYFQQQHYQSVGGVYIEDKNFYQQQLLIQQQQQQQNLINADTGLQNVTADATVSSGNDDYNKYSDHIYESPKSIRKELEKLSDEKYRMKNLPQPFI
ncbi:hypothetical protein HELRODRAFT_177878 [Helobdella robusta]|uniref:SUEL-type lectin domain-containing protein n=1 Tax=Helobdella robusta TaxID=6412 RepID=T1FCE7_HELRO|nr:hypothetical protein HELRODRAFT_177878 [Helobdella robusta]ESN97813.1 hypothetical protein HELRODRAFT_177878 [Helobdella robusta]